MRLSIYQGLLLLYKLLQTSAEQCTSGTFHINPDKRDVQLHGFTYRTFENISPRACFKKCIQRKRCHSYNYNRASLRCELNLKPMYISEGYFKNVVGFVYPEVHPYKGDPLFDPCIGNPCDEGEVCESLKNEKVVCVLEDCKTPIEAFQNVALGKMCGQSSTYLNEHAEYAVDGLTNTAPHTLQDQSPYWWVDLGNIYNIIRIEVINRWSSGYRLHDLDISFGTHLDDMSIFAHYTGPAVDNEHLVFHRSRYTEGRYVKLTITQGPEMLHPSEVIVVACTASLNIDSNSYQRNHAILNTTKGSLPYDAAITSQNIGYITLPNSRCVLQIDPDRMIVIFKATCDKLNTTVSCVSSLLNTGRDLEGTVPCFLGVNKDGCFYPGGVNFEEISSNITGMSQYGHKIGSRVLRFHKINSQSFLSCIGGQNYLTYTYSMYRSGYHSNKKITENKICNFATMDTPTDICSDDKGHIYVSGQGSNNIHRLVEDRKYSHFTDKMETDWKVLDIPLDSKHGIKEPVALCFTQDYSRLYIVNEWGKSVLVFNVM